MSPRGTVGDETSRDELDGGPLMPRAPWTGDPGRAWLARAAAVLVVVAAVAALVTFGRLRPAHPGRPRDVDPLYCYVGGLAWRLGLDPYDYGQYRRAAARLGTNRIDCCFAYAPTSAALAIPFSRLSPADSERLVVVLNVASALTFGLALAVAAGRRLGPGELGAWRPLALAGVAALAIASPQAALNLYMGQTTLFCLALVGLALWAEESGRPGLAGALLAVASFKITLPVFVIALALLERRWRLVAALAAVGVALASYPLLRDGPVGLARGWLGSVRMYKGFVQNFPDYTTSVGLAGVLKGHGLPYGWTPLVALGVLAWLWLRGRRADPLERYAVALALPVLFVSGHAYDLVALVPLSLASLLATRRRPAAFAGVALGVGLLALPPSVWDVLFPFRGGKEGVALALLAVMMACVERRAGEGEGPGAGVAAGG